LTPSRLLNSAGQTARSLFNLANHGGFFTDDMEREIMRRLSGKFPPRRLSRAL